MTKYVQVPEDLLEQLREQVMIVSSLEDEGDPQSIFDGLEALGDRAAALVVWRGSEIETTETDTTAVLKVWTEWVNKFESALPPEWWDLTKSAVAAGYNAAGREELDSAADVFAQLVRDHEGAVLPEYGRGRKDAYAHAERELRDRANGLK